MTLHWYTVSLTLFFRIVASLDCTFVRILPRKRSYTIAPRFSPCLPTDIALSPSDSFRNTVYGSLRSSGKIIHHRIGVFVKKTSVTRIDRSLPLIIVNSRFEDERDTFSSGTRVKRSVRMK